VRHAAKRHARRRDGSPIRRDDRGHGHQREGVRRPVADLAVDLPAQRRRRQNHVRDHLARLEDRLDVGCLAGQTVKVSDGDAAPSLSGAQQLDLRLEGRHRDGHVRRMGCDARVARAEDRVRPVDSTDRGAA
jgi:hypothetical protein